MEFGISNVLQKLLHAKNKLFLNFLHRFLPVIRHYGPIQLAFYWFLFLRSIANQVKVKINSTLSTVLGFKLLFGGDAVFSVRKQ